MKDFSELKDMLLSSIGKAADAGKEFAAKAADASKDIANNVADKAKAGSRIAKLSVEIATEKDNMKKAYIEMGKLYYDTHKDDPEGFFIQLCEEITLAQKNIEEKEAEIAELKTKGEDDGTIEVEFEEVVAGEEGAAQCCCQDTPAEEAGAEETPAEDAPCCEGGEEAPREEKPEE